MKRNLELRATCRAQKPLRGFGRQRGVALITAVLIVALATILAVSVGQGKVAAPFKNNLDLCATPHILRRTIDDIGNQEQLSLLLQFNAPEKIRHTICECHMEHVADHGKRMNLAATAHLRRDERV